MALAETSRLASAGAQLNYEIWANSLVQFMMFAAGTVAALALRGRAPTIGRIGRALLLTSGGTAWFVAAVVCNAKGSGAAIAGFGVPIGYALAAIGCACIFMAIIGVRAKMPSPLVYLGRISFGLYVFHELVIHIVQGTTIALGHPLGPVSTSPLSLALTIALAALSFNHFETPFLRKKQRLAAIDTRPVT